MGAAGSDARSTVPRTMISESRLSSSPFLGKWCRAEPDRIYQTARRSKPGVGEVLDRIYEAAWRSKPGVGDVLDRIYQAARDRKRELETKT